MANLQATRPTPPSAAHLARRVSVAVRHLFAAETREVAGILSSMGEAVAILRSALEDAQDETSIPAIHQAASSLAASLTILHPAREELARALAGSEAEPVLLLNRRQSDEERRGAERVAVEAVIGFQSETNFFTGFSGDLSDGGLFIATWDVLPVDAELELSFILPDGRQINAAARVSWVRDPPRTSDETHQPGMGVVFEGLSESDRQAVMEFIRLRAPLFHDT